MTARALTSYCGLRHRRFRRGCDHSRGIARSRHLWNISVFPETAIANRNHAGLLTYEGNGDSGGYPTNKRSVLSTSISAYYELNCQGQGGVPSIMISEATIETRKRPA